MIVAGYRAALYWTLKANHGDHERLYKYHYFRDIKEMQLAIKQWETQYKYWVEHKMRVETEVVYTK